MQEAATYREKADECRKMAITATYERQRELLLKMADQWDALALSRESLIANFALPKLD